MSGRLILASASPRRLDLLAQIGIVPDDIVPADIDEAAGKSERPLDLVKRLAAAKAREADLLDLGVDRDIISKSGTWFSYGGERLGQGRENCKSFLRANPDTAAAIEEKVRAELGLPVPVKEAVTA